MKNLISTLLLVLGLLPLASAQVASAFTVAPNPADTIALPDADDAPAEAEIHNISSNTLNVRWTRTVVNITPGCYTQVCDPVTCWSETVSTKTFSLAPGEEGQLTVHFRNPNAIEASSIVHIKVVNLDNPADTLTAVYNYVAAPLVSTKDLPTPSVKLFPNPTVESFSLQNGEAVAGIQVYALDGRSVARFEVSPNNFYSLAGQPAGTYVLALEDKNGIVFQALELSKR